MRTTCSLYRGLKIVLATMHNKEAYLNSASEKILGATLFTCGDKMNTDSLGTFSGETQRQGTQIRIFLHKPLFLLAHLTITLSSPSR